MCLVVARRGRSRTLLLALSTLVLVAGCAGTGTGTDRAAVRGDFPVPTRCAGYGAAQPALLDAGWVQSFASPQLEALVSEALAANRDIRVAAARLEESNARARQAGAEGIPSLTAALEAEGNDGADNSVDLDVAVAWEIDLWGRIRGNRAAAGFDALAAERL